MAGNGWKLLEMVVNGLKWLNMAENWLGLAENGLKLLEIPGNIGKGLDMAGNG